MAKARGGALVDRGKREVVMGGASAILSKSYNEIILDYTIGL